MAGDLHRLDSNHIGVQQLKMSVDRVLQCYIRNMPGPPSPLIENYLREAGFWHVATIGRGFKLDPVLISALIERWRPETHTFHLPCGECSITLEDVQLQLGLPVDGSVVTGTVTSLDWMAVCYELLGAIPDKLQGGRIDMVWLRDTFPQLNEDSTEDERIRYARAYILQIIGGYLMPDVSRNLVHLRWLLKLVDFRAASEFSWGSAVLSRLYREMCGATVPDKAKIGGCLSLLQSWAWFRFPFLRPQLDQPYSFPLITRWNHPRSHVGIPDSLEDIRLLLEQRSESQFQWTPYEDPEIRAVIPEEFLQNPNSWHVKVPLITYATVEMHQSDRVLRQFGCRQPIPVAPEVLDDEHSVDLRRQHTDWPIFWSEHIEKWENRYDFLPNREPIVVPELACVPEYMPWFRIHGKPYLLSAEERRRQIRERRERRAPLHPRRRGDETGPATAPTQSPGPSTAPIQSPGPSTAPIQSPGPSVQLTTPITQRPQFMPGAYPAPYMYPPNPYMFPFSSPPPGWNPWPGSSPFPTTPFSQPIVRPTSGVGLEEVPSGSSSFYQTPSPYGMQSPPPWFMQTPPGSLFYQGGSSSQHPEPDPLPEGPDSPPEVPQPPPETRRRRNPARNRRPPSCGTGSHRHPH